MAEESKAILALKPVSFYYDQDIDENGLPQFGLVAAVNPDLVVRDDQGEIYTVRYEAVNAMLLNEFLKEHHKVAKQEATIAQLKEQIEALVAHSKEQDSQIQRVHDRMQMNNPEARVALSNQ